MPSQFPIGQHDRRAALVIFRLNPVVFLLLVAASIPAFSQAPTASVRVEVRAGSVPVPGAKVTISSKTIATDVTGIAVIPVPLGNVEVAVAKEGFLPGIASLAITEPREWHIILELQPQPSQKEEITVHATRTDTRFQDSPTSVEVLEQEEIDEKPMMTPGDIVMMLNEMGGLRVQTTSPSLGAASVRIQGMRGRYTRFLSAMVFRFSASRAAGWAFCRFLPWIWAKSR